MILVDASLAGQIWCSLSYGRVVEALHKPVLPWGSRGGAWGSSEPPCALQGLCSLLFRVL